MINLDYEIVKVQGEDFQQLSDLSKRIYAQTYTYLWFDKGEWYMEKMYNSRQILAELRDENVEFYFFIFQDIPIGYLKLNLNSKISVNALEIERIYFDNNFLGKGFGSILLSFGIEKAKKLGKESVILKVMNCQSEAVRFYEKHGFVTVGSIELDFNTMKEQYRQLNTMILSFEKM